MITVLVATSELTVGVVPIVAVKAPVVKLAVATDAYLPMAARLDALELSHEPTALQASAALQAFLTEPLQIPAFIKNLTWLGDWLNNWLEIGRAHV